MLTTIELLSKNQPFLLAYLQSPSAECGGDLGGAPRPELVVAQMKVSLAFDTLSKQEKWYHGMHIIWLALHGSPRIILEQVSPEANGVFDFIRDPSCL